MNTKDIKVPGFERVVQTELAPGVVSIIAIHNTKFGPGLGGCRFFNYNTHQDALTDAMRLAEGMSYKSAMAGLALGGGKSVIAGDPKKVKTQGLLEAYGDFVESLGGLYYTAKDVGISLTDLDIIASRTQYIGGINAPHSSGDPSPVTAYGVFHGIMAAAKFLWDDPSVKNKAMIVQGLGHVGLDVARRLVENGAAVYATEVDKNTLDKAVKDLGITPLGLDDWLTTKADIFCPNAMGAILNPDSIPKLAANGIKIVAGSANNQLLEIEADGQLLKNSEILYAPDYIINAGGVINIACEFGTYSQKKAYEKTSKIYDTTLTIFNRARDEDRPTAVVSLEMAREKLGI